MNLRTKLLTALAVVATIGIAAQAQVPGVNSTLNAVFTLAYDQGTMKPTYSASAIVVPVSTTAQDVCVLIGSATKNVRVRRLIVGGIASVSQTEAVAIVTRNTIDTGGTQTLATPVAWDSTNSLTGSTTNTATAVAETFTANPTLGTINGTVAEFMITWGNLSTTAAVPVTYTFGQLGSPLVLRGAAQQAALNLAGMNLVSGQIACTWEWTEE